MYIERTNTIFDKTKMNWAAFVKQQAEFFRFAREHIRNLELDLDKINALIEEALESCEGAKLNVAQGYKVFRRLKDLRNERKAILSELQKIQAITDRFDCDIMKAIYEEIEEEYASSSGHASSDAETTTSLISEAV